MYIHPYWLGVLTVVVAELAAFFLAGVLGSVKKKKDKK